MAKTGQQAISHIVLYDYVLGQGPWQTTANVLHARAVNCGVFLAWQGHHFQEAALTCFARAARPPICSSRLLWCFDMAPLHFTGCLMNSICFSLLLLPLHALRRGVMLLEHAVRVPGGAGAVRRFVIHLESCWRACFSCPNFALWLHASAILW